MELLSWLIRYGHVVFAATWVGGYALLALVIVPSLGKDSDETLVRLAINTVRLLTYTGTLTMIFGIVLITRTRGFYNFVDSAWGGYVMLAFLIAVALLGIGDGLLRPAIKRLVKTGRAPARLWATVGLFLTIIAVGVMTGATFVR